MLTYPDHVYAKTTFPMLALHYIHTFLLKFEYIRPLKFLKESKIIVLSMNFVIHTAYYMPKFILGRFSTVKKT